MVGSRGRRMARGAKEEGGELGGGGGRREDDEGAGEICSEVVEKRRPIRSTAYFPRSSRAIRRASSTPSRCGQLAGATSSALV